MADILAAWSSFYVLIGTSAAALTGLMFVVITLVSGGRGNPTREGISTFSTPTVVHFSCALFTSALMTAPFPTLQPVAVIVGLGGAGGLFYTAGVGLRSTRLDGYRIDAEDLVWHIVLPLIAYASLVAGAIAIRAAPVTACYAPAAGVALLVAVGIHNAWDVVTFITTNDTIPSGSDDDPNHRAPATKPDEASNAPADPVGGTVQTASAPVNSAKT